MNEKFHNFGLSISSPHVKVLEFPRNTQFSYITALIFVRSISKFSSVEDKTTKKKPNKTKNI